MKRKITVLIADDHALVRRALRRVLEDESSIAVVGEAGHGAEAVEMACRLGPGVVLMDCTMPGMNGLAATKQILKSRSEIAVLICSVHSEKNWVRRAHEAGARGYLFKSAGDMHLAEAVKRVASGELLFDPAVLDSPSSKSHPQPASLSERELQVLQLIVDGKSNREIAACLNLSANTISAHRANIMSTLRVHKTAELVAYAIREGLANLS